MRAIRFHDYGGPEVLRYEQDVPEPSLAPDAVLIEVDATSVNPIDWKIRSGARQKDFPLQLPAIPGRDVSGVVRAAGADVRGSWRRGSRHCPGGGDLRRTGGGARCTGHAPPR